MYRFGEIFIIFDFGNNLDHCLDSRFCKRNICKAILDMFGLDGVCSIQVLVYAIIYETL